MVLGINHTQEQWTVITGRDPVSSLDRESNPGVTQDSMRTFLGKSFTKKATDQVKTSSRQLRFSKPEFKLSKPLAALTQVALGRVNQLNTTYKQLNKTNLKRGGV